MNFSSLFLIVRRSLRQHALSTVVTIFSIALATGLAMGVFSVQRQAYEAFAGQELGIDAILGAKGSHLQLVLNTIFHLETSPGNIPYSNYKTWKSDPRVDFAIAYGVGDNYHGYRIVGTTDELFTNYEYRPGKKLSYYAGGRKFDSDKREAVIGAYAAEKTGLRVGSIFNPYHGVVFKEDMKHPQEYVVTGILEPTNTPMDRVLWIPLEGIYRMENHVMRGSGKEIKANAGEAIPDEYKEVAAVLIKFKDPVLGQSLAENINLRSKELTLAYPVGSAMSELLDKLGWATKVLELVAYLVVIVAGFSILASIHNTMNERRRDFAILRALGARRATVFTTIVLEAGSIAALGSLCGFFVYAVILYLAAGLIRAQTGVVLNAFEYHPAMLYVPLAMTGIGALAGLIPAWKAYRTDVAGALMN